MDHQRKPNRLSNYDYSQNGAYFITICVKDMKCILSYIDNVPLHTVRDGFHTVPNVRLTSTGIQVENTIHYMNKAYPEMIISDYVIMPNHIHLMIELSCSDNMSMNGGRNLPVHEYVRRLKTYTTKQHGQKLWKRNYHDHIIRDEEDYFYHRQYIRENPKKWLMGKDEYYA